MFIGERGTEVELIIQRVRQRELDARTRRAILIVHRDVYMARGPNRLQGQPGKILSFRQGDACRSNDDYVLVSRSFRQRENRPGAGAQTYTETAVVLRSEAHDLASGT